VVVGSTTSGAWQVTTGSGAASEVYVANGNLVAVNVATHAIDATIGPFHDGGGTSGQPVRGGIYEYVPDNMANIAVIDTTNNTELLELTPSATAVLVANPSGTQVYALINGNKQIAVIDTASNTIIQTITLTTVGGPNAGVFDPTGTYFYVVTSGSTSQLTKIATSTGNTASVVGSPLTVGTNSNPQDIAISPDGSKLYIANYATNSAAAVNATGWSVTAASIATGALPIKVAIDSTGTYAYVVSTSSNNVTAINIGTNTPTTITNANLNLADSIAVSSGGNVYVGGNAASFVEINGTAVTGTLSTGVAGATYLSMNKAGTDVWAINAAGNKVYEFDTTTNAAVGTATSLTSSPSYIEAGY
jgi:DNA-binding beta-propeller fold protein YncE